MDKKILVFIAVLALFIAGCSGEGDQQGPDMTTPFIGGTVGLNAYLLDGIPPPVIQDNNQSPFSFAVVLENQGESDIGPGSSNPYTLVKIEGINPEQWGLPGNETRTSLNQPLRGARKNFDGTILPGEITQVSFEGMTYEPNIRGNTEFVIRADVCYDYSTISTTQVCIKDDVLENIQDTTICTLTGEKEPRNSGAPIHITSMIQNPLAENKIQVNFMIEHVGIGQFYGRTEEETCRPTTSNFNKNKLDMVVRPLSDSRYTIKCPRLGNTNQGRIQLWQGAPQRISCIIERTGESEGRIFQDILEVELRYRYGQFIETPIIVQDVSNEPGQIVGASDTPEGTNNGGSGQGPGN